ncbi:MAG: DMT family transporter [Treponema sp.]|jgi:drug/metabolite transporter (DMT)-like permease|nr:DMT family transporter [Treponema sp.]
MHKRVQASSARKTAILANAACVLFWGFSFISIKIAVRVFPPMTLGALRFAIAIIILGAVKRIRNPRETLAPRDIPLLALSGISGVTLYFFCENNGVALVSASEASIIIGAIPVLTMFVEWIAEKRRRNAGAPAFKARSWLGVLLSLAGVALVAGVSITLSGNAAGYLFMGGAALSWVAYGFLTKPLFIRHSRSFIVFWQNLFGFLGFIPFALTEFSRWGNPAPGVVLHVLFLAICCSALGYLFYAHALNVLGVSISSVFVNLIPVVAVAAAFVILGERLAPLQWGGAALVLAGVYLTVMP